MTDPVRTYQGWWEVPAGMLTATALRDLEFPRHPTDRPHAWVKGENWRGKKDTFALYRAEDCPPTAASAAHLDAAAARSGRPRSCADCPAICQRSLPADVGGRPLCPACRNVVLLRQAQEKARQAQAAAAAEVAEVLAWPGAVVVQVDQSVPPPTPAGTRRKPIAARIRACDVATGTRLTDVLVSLAGTRSRLRDPAARESDDVAPVVHGALLGRPLLCWSGSDTAALRAAVPHPDWPTAGRYGSHPRAWLAESTSRWWRAQLDDRRQYVPSLPPGTPARLLLHLRRIAATAEEVA
ncbi:hypothetical protein QLQ12_25000 [Actinoplanes sp. NEAU-A12]|uniref:Uncharacterized protein n=1 Tax=Actinoplanes sandaracinus TaxID=3045177 RepID=A0ABT6WQ47_9ACTN|nr:hypothetical protein [Actinoplanes sandaracinus]MDI6101881.1 hypothetical protein [Actinoplanes sandaracinus]